MTLPFTTTPMRPKPLPLALLQVGLCVCGLIPLMGAVALEGLCRRYTGDNDDAHPPAPPKTAEAMKMETRDGLRTAIHREHGLPERIQLEVSEDGSTLVFKSDHPGGERIAVVGL